MLAQSVQPVYSETIRPGLGYAGDVTPEQAWEILQQNSQAQLIDVRTSAEWMFVGMPDLTSLNKEVIQISWRLYPSFMINTEFTQSFLLRNLPEDAPLFFICRSGGRSRDAAIAVSSLGFTQCYNVEDGFEGEPDQEGHRGTASGWKNAGLPWGQK